MSCLRHSSVDADPSCLACIRAMPWLDKRKPDFKDRSRAIHEAISELEATIARAYELKKSGMNIITAANQALDELALKEINETSAKKKRR